MYLLPLPRIEPRFPGCPARTLVTICDDIILSDNSRHYFTHFRVTAVNATLAAVYVCHDLEPTVLVQYIAVNIMASLAISVKGAGMFSFDPQTPVMSDKHFVHCTPQFL